MAMNPMQRRTRNSFLIGFLVSLIIMSLIVIFLLYRIQGLNEKYEALEDLQSTAYVSADDITSGTEVTMDDFTKQTVRTTLSKAELLSADDFEFIDEETGEIIEKYDSEGNPKEKTMIVKTNIPAGSIITKDMLEEVDNPITDDQRMQEYNMIILPTMLESGQYIDIRLKLPGGEDYIVVSKKQVLETDATTVWMKMTEDEILTMGNAIVEAYAIAGSKLYATTYTEAGRQDAAVQTYPVNQAVLTLINSDPNVVQEAKEALWRRYNEQEQVEQRNNHINSALSDNAEGSNEAIQAGIQEETTALKAAREAYVKSLGE